MRVDLVALLTDSTDYYHSWILISNLTNRSDSSNGAVSIPTQEKKSVYNPTGAEGPPCTTHSLTPFQIRHSDHQMSNHPEREHDAIADEENAQDEFIDPDDVLVEMIEDDGADYPMDGDEEEGEEGEDAAGPSGADIIYEDTSIQRFTGHTNSVFAVAVHPSAQIAVSGGEDDLGYLWDYMTGEELVKLTGHSDSVTNVGFSHDGEMVATGGMDGRVRVWKRVGKEEFRKWTFLTELQGPDEVTVSLGLVSSLFFALNSALCSG